MSARRRSLQLKGGGDDRSGLIKIGVICGLCVPADAPLLLLAKRNDAPA